MFFMWIGSLFVSLVLTFCSAADVITIPHDVSGPAFHGIGALSAGAPSRLLIDYSDDNRSNILDYLFKPNYGASLQILKVEIGGDGQSTQGVESSIKHYEWEEPNAVRGYEWFLLREAKKRNPNIKVWGLPWAFPGWLGDGVTKGFPYTNVTKTAKYIIDWIKTGQSLNITVDWIGICNERDPYGPYIIELRRQLDRNGFKNVKIDASDEDTMSSIVNLMISNEAVKDAVAAIGVHYPILYNYPPHSQQAIQLHKPFISTEDDSTLASQTKTGCIARTLNHNFIQSNYTGTILWALLGAILEGLPYQRVGLITPNEPWSGWYQVESALWAVAHTTQFTRVGWKYLKSASVLLSEGGSVTGYVSPNGEDVTLVIEAASHEQSQCQYTPANTAFKVADRQTVTLKIDAKWKTREFVLLRSNVTLGLDTKKMMQYVTTLRPNANSEIVLTVERDDLWTVTTMPYLSAKVDRTPKSAPSAAFPSPYRDDFEDTQFEKEGRYWMQQNGVFEVVPAPTGYSLGPGVGSIGKRVLRQRLLTGPVNWTPCKYVGTSTFSVIGNNDWNDVNITAIVSIPSRADNGSDGVMLGARMKSTGLYSFTSPGVFAWLTTEGLSISTDASQKSILGSTKDVMMPRRRWTKMTLAVTGNKVQVYVNDKLALKSKLNFFDSLTIGSGLVVIGTPSYGFTDFDSVEITGDAIRPKSLDVYNDDWFDNL